MQIVKGDGTREEFDITKLENSMVRSGAKPEVAKGVAEKIAARIKEGMTTTHIYKSAYRELKKEQNVLAAKYSMRRAILDLGPTGFPFEDYFCELMRAKGYDAKVRQIIRGKCATHEVDVVLKMGKHSIGAELKFHNKPGFKTDLKTALYVKARFDDIHERERALKTTSHIHEGWLVTNTKYTKNAIKYANCTGIGLLGWDYPEKGNLADLIEETKLYPITVLTTLSEKEKTQLLKNGVPLCKTIADHPDELLKAGILKKKHGEAIAESKSICSI